MSTSDKELQDAFKRSQQVQKQNDGMVVSAQVTDFYSKSETKCLYQKRKQYI